MKSLDEVSWPTAALGAVAGVALTFAFVLAVGPVLSVVVSGLPEYLAYGLMLLFVSAFRAVAGMWTAMRFRARFEVAERTDFLPTAVAAALGGWALYAVTLLVIGAATSTDAWSWRLVLESLRWVAEYCVGALLVSTVAADPLEVARRRRAQQARERSLP